MKKGFTILMALVITFFTVPFGGITALADGKVYDDIEDGEYEINIKLLKEGTDEKSAAADFMSKEATLILKEGKVELTFYIPNNPMMNFNKFEVEGIEPVVEEVEDLFHYSFKLNELKTKLSSEVSYEVPMINLVHDNVGMDIELVGLDKLPVKEEEVETPEEPEEIEDTEEPDENDDYDGSENESDEDNESGSEDGTEEEDSNGSENEPGDNEESLIEIADADENYEMEFITDSSSTKRQFNNPVTLLIKDGKKYIQMNGTGGQFITSLTVNGSEVTWGEKDDEGNFIIQFELPGTPSDELNFGMTIDTGNPQFGEMTHNVSLSFGNRVKPNEPTVVSGGDKILVENTQLTMPENLPEDVKVTISPKKTVENQGDLEIAGEIYEFDFENLGDNSGTFELVMSYDQGKYNSDDYDVDIYYFNGSNWEAQNGKVENGKVTLKVDHFSTYGVFAKEVKQAEGPDEDENEPITELDPENLSEGVYTLDYTFLKKGEDQASSMDSFTDGPAFVKVDQDGNQFVALTLTSADMIQWFKVNGKEVTILQENEENQTRIVEFEVDNLTEKQAGKVFVEVPGMYSTDHEVDLVFNVDSLEEADDNEYPENENVKPEPKPEPGTEDPTEEKPSGEKEKPEQPTTPVEQSELTPDKAYEIDYIVNHENGTSVSISNEFFVKPAILLEKDGVKYVQITITNGDLIKDLSNKYGDALLVDTKEDGSIVVQLRINDDLTDMLIDMHIIVPSGFFQGFPGYDEQHKAILVFDKDSMKEIDVDKQLLVPGSEENKNGPTIKGGGSGGTIGGEGPGKPEFGSNDDNGKNDKDIKKSGKNGNPQTGDTTNILLYSLLFIGSLIPLAVKLRRRLYN